MSRLIERTDDRPMTRLAERMKPSREATPDESAVIEGVRAMARNATVLSGSTRAAFLAEVRRLSSGRMRFLATAYTPPDHPDFRSLMAMLDGLMATEPGIVQTVGGAFTVDELREVGAMMRGRELVLFPVRYATGGVPVFRSEAERGPRIESFRVVPRGDVREPSSPWIDDEDGA